MRMLRVMLREPLLHFAIIGTLMFAGYAMLAQQPGDEGTNRIVVDAPLIERLERDFARQWRRPPDSVEREGLIQAYLREEVLYREALARGLDRNDGVVRQRLARKMEAFAIINAGVPDEPSETDLRAHFDKHIERFATSEQVSFTHVFLDRDSRGDRLYADALAILDRLRASDANAVRLGDVPFTRSSYEGTTKREVSRQLGRNFARQLFELGTGTWQGPIQSGFGLHLVLLTERMPSRNPAFEDVALEIRRSHAESQRREIRSAVFAEMRRRYVVEMPPSEEASLK